jgi:hypothetical protein
MSETISGGAASVSGAVSVPAAGPDKTVLIAGLKAKLLEDITAFEAAAGVVLDEARAELEAIGTDAESFWAKVEAWINKHF